VNQFDQPKKLGRRSGGTKNQTDDRKNRPKKESPRKNDQGKTQNNIFKVVVVGDGENLIPTINTIELAYKPNYISMRTSFSS